MTAQQQYELRPFDATGREMETVFVRKSGDAAARSQAGRLSVANDGPVDLARAGNADWGDRYITTASPSEYHKAGFRFERLEN